MAASEINKVWLTKLIKQVLRFQNEPWRQTSLNLLLFLSNETGDVLQEEAKANISLNPNDGDYDK